MTEPRNRRGLGIRFAAAAALVIGTIGLASAPANAVGGCTISGFGSGTIGVPQTLSEMGCGSPLLATYPNGATDVIPFYSTGAADQAVWTPNHLGRATLTSSTDGAADSYTADIATTPTSTVVSAPNTAQVGVATQVTVTVNSVSPSNYVPTGTVTVRDATGATITTLGLTPGSGNGQSYAYWRYTATNPGNVVFIATYNGDTNARTSVSPQDLMIVTPSGGNISISAPSQVTAGVPVTLTANVYPHSTQGSVGFTINGAAISASVQLVNGAASYLWTPTGAGNVTLGASFTTNQGGSGSTSQPLTIIAGPVTKDYITLTQVGAGPWAPNGSYTLGAGTYQFTATSLSGAQVRVGESGPCSWSGYTLTVPTGGQCNIQAATNGGNGYAPASQGYTVTAGLGTQTAALAAPNSGKVNYKKVIKLETPAQGTTNANQNVMWTVAKKSKSVCALVFPADGSVNLKFKARGFCTVTATAPGIPGQWAPFVLQRTYQGA